MSTLESLGGKLGEAIGSRMVDKPPEPPPDPDEPTPPPNPKQELADKIKAATAAANTVSQVASVIADPAGALKDFAKSEALQQMDKLIPGFSKAVGELAEYASPAGLELLAAKLTNNISAALGPFPAATLTSLALGVPHAHVKHPPSGPPPLPPVPLPPMGPVLLGTCIQVLINSKPAARCGDLGINPTCCGVLPPLSAMYEIMTGSSNVYFGGTRAARVGIDITLHCQPGGGAGKAASAAGKMSKLQKVAAVAAKVASVASKVAAVGQVASDYAQAEADDNAAMASAIALNAAMTAAQMAADAIAAAMSKQKGTDLPMIPPTGTPGMILNGAATVMVGGLPMPSFAKVAAALSNRVKGLRGSRGGGGGGGGGGGPPPCHPSTT